METFADSLYTDEFVYSPVNLGAFLKWATTATEAELGQAFQVINMVMHRMDPELQGSAPILPVTVIRGDLNRQFTIVQLQCHDPVCERCLSGRGGYQFRWIGPWTCPNTVGDENTSAREVYQRTIACRCGLH